VTGPPPAEPDEAWGFEWGTAAGDGGFVRLALHRTERVAWFWAYVLRPGGGPVVVRDHEVTLPRGAALEIRAEALWAELVCETPGEHWSIGLEAFGVRLDDADDATRGEIGERIAVGFDCEWETAGEPFTTALGGVTTVEQPGVVRGEVLLGRDRIPLDTVGRFEHEAGALDTAGSASRSTVAWDDGSWWSLRSQGGEPDGARWDGGHVGPLGVTGVEIAVQAEALIPVRDHVAIRGLGAATDRDRRGTGWIASVAQPRAKIT
jgi:hypothetical protein